MKFRDLKTRNLKFRDMKTRGSRDFKYRDLHHGFKNLGFQGF